jgi:hypothetical protein
MSNKMENHGDHNALSVSSGGESLIGVGNCKQLKRKMLATPEGLFLKKKQNKVIGDSRSKVKEFLGFPLAFFFSLTFLLIYLRLCLF